MARKQNDFEQVEQFIATLKHPMKVETSLLRQIIKSASPRLSERIKWNAPSYHLDGVDILTFGPFARKMDELLLVLHHPSVVKIDSPILEGNFKDRRLIVFKSMAEVERRRNELTKIVQMIIADIETFH